MWSHSFNLYFVIFSVLQIAFNVKLFIGVQGWCSGVSGWFSGDYIHLSPMWPGFYLGLLAMSGLSLLLVLYPVPRGFPLGSLIFPSPQKSAIPNSSLIGSLHTWLCHKETGCYFSPLAAISGDVLSLTKPTSYSSCGLLITPKATLFF